MGVEQRWSVRHGDRRAKWQARRSSAELRRLARLDHERYAGLSAPRPCRRDRTSITIGSSWQPGGGAHRDFPAPALLLAGGGVGAEEAQTEIPVVLGTVLGCVVDCSEESLTLACVLRARRLSSGCLGQLVLSRRW